MDHRFAFLRDYYGVPATQGGRVIYTGSGQPQQGKIVSVEGARLRIKLDGQQYVGLYHPTWELEYLEEPLPDDSQPFVDDVCPTCPSRAPAWWVRAFPHIARNLP